MLSSSLPALTILLRRSILPVPGHYTYKYKVDGQWRVSLREAVVTQGHNQNNSVTVADTVTYRWQPSWGGEEVYVVGAARPVPLRS